MRGQPIENLKKANTLYHQAQLAQLSFGCFEVSLQALGAEMHYLDILDREKLHRDSSILDVIQRSGLVISWIASLAEHVSAQYIEDLMEDRLTADLPHTPGFKTGHLFLENYPEPEDDESRSNHAVAVLARGTLPHSVRKQLKRNSAYTVIDTNNGGVKAMTTEQISRYARDVSRHSGQLSVVQIKKPLRETR